MQLESLANELLLDVFDYFDVIHLFRAFHGLNARLDGLLLINFHAYAVDFQSVSKHDFDIFCRKYLPLITKRVVSLRLSDDDETPNQPNYFLSDYFTISQFTSLKFLKLHGLASINLLLKMVLNCRHLPCLTHLKVTELYFPNAGKFNDLINSIWSLPKLAHCHLDSNVFRPTSLIKPTLISLSIEYLSMKSISYSSNSLIELLKHTPHLQHLCATLIHEQVLPQSFTVAPLVTRLTISIKYSLSGLSYLFKMMPNLSHVKLEITRTLDHDYLNGHQWEKVIVKRLSNIKVFQFLVRFQSSQPTYNIEKSIDKVLDTFRTPFWLNEHRWFVRCEWNPHAIDQLISLYTLSHSLDGSYALYPTIRSKSTCPAGQDVWAYNDVCHIISKNDVLDWGPSCILVPKIGHLKVILPTDNNIWSYISTIDHLTSLKVSLDNKTSLSQLQALIDRAPRLYSLAVQRASASQLAQLNIIHTGLRQVSLADYCFNAPECSLIAGSPLGRQCEVLSIDVTDRRHIPGLISEMPSLRALRCYCEDNKWELDESLLSVTGDTIKWLEDQLPSAYSISSCMRDHLRIRMWLD